MQKLRLTPLGRIIILLLIALVLSCFTLAEQKPSGKTGILAESSNNSRKAIADYLAEKVVSNK